MRKKTVIIEIEQEAYNQMHQALKRFGNCEIGGMLIGYKIGDNHLACYPRKPTFG